MSPEITAIHRAIDDLKSLEKLLESEARGRARVMVQADEPFGYYIIERDSDGDSIEYFSKRHPTQINFLGRTLISYFPLFVDLPGDK